MSFSHLQFPNILIFFVDILNLYTHTFLISPANYSNPFLDKILNKVTYFMNHILVEDLQLSLNFSVKNPLFKSVKFVLPLQYYFHKISHYHLFTMTFIFKFFSNVQFFFFFNTVVIFQLRKWTHDNMNSWLL